MILLDVVMPGLDGDAVCRHLRDAAIGAQRLFAEVEDAAEAEPAGEYVLKGFRRPVTAFTVLSVRD